MRRLLVLVATAAIGTLGLLPLVPDGASGAPAYPPIRPTRVLVLGDSVMKGAATAYAGKLPGRDVVVDAEVNRTTGQGVAVVDRLGTDWDVAIILLGHNDGGSPGAYQPAARQILDRLRGVRHVVWLTLHEVRSSYPGVNQFVSGLEAGYPNLSTADWNAIANANPGALASDGLHLNGSGADLLSDLVAEQVHLSELEWHAALVRLATTTTSAPPTTTTTAPPSTSTTTTTTTPSTTSRAVTSTTRPGSRSMDCVNTGREVTCTATPEQVAGTPPYAAIVVLGGATAVAGTWTFRRVRRRNRPLG